MNHMILMEMINLIKEKSIINENVSKEEINLVKKINNTLTNQDKEYLGPRWFYDDSQYRNFHCINKEPVAYIESRIIGTKAYLEIVVHPKYRKKGIAKNLIAKAMEEIPSKFKDVERLYWVVKEDNIPSIHLANKLGFTKIAEKNKELRFILEIK